MFKRLVAGMAIVSAVALAPAEAHAEPPSATVIKVVDGDTVDVRHDSGREERVRMLGIDTPETKHPQKGVECWGPEATQFAKDNLLGRRVALALDPTQDETDSYGRLLAYVTDGDGWWYNVEAVRAGAATVYVYDQPVLIHSELVEVERDAKAAGRGLWGAPCFGNR
ncbi:thermonuclease family protein [Nocardia goodfellowii]